MLTFLCPGRSWQWPWLLDMWWSHQSHRGLCCWAKTILTSYTRLLRSPGQHNGSPSLRSVFAILASDLESLQSFPPAFHGWWSQVLLSHRDQVNACLSQGTVVKGTRRKHSEPLKLLSCVTNSALIIRPKSTPLDSNTRDGCLLFQRMCSSHCSQGSTSHPLGF